MILIYVTHENEREAQKIIDHLLERKLIACANTMPIRSCYFWEGRKEDSAEVATLLKTRDGLWDAVRDEVKSIHPYKVPCIMRMEVTANAEYEEWIKETTWREAARERAAPAFSQQQPLQTPSNQQSQGKGI